MRLEDFKPGMWIRSKLEPNLGRAFVLFVKDGVVTYHLERPYAPHPRLIDGWTTGGSLYPPGFENWEPDNTPRPEGKESKPCDHEFDEICIYCGKRLVEYVREPQSREEPK